MMRILIKACVSPITAAPIQHALVARCPGIGVGMMMSAPAIEGAVERELEEDATGLPGLHHGRIDALLYGHDARRGQGRLLRRGGRLGADPYVIEDVWTSRT